MVPVDIEAGIQKLAACLRQIESTLAWADLVDQETRPDTPPSFRIDHHT